MSFTTGENVGPYRITDRLGQGGMATVYRAYHANLDRYVAIKVLHATFKDDASFLTRFQREAQIVAKLEHPSIVPVYDYSEHNGDPYLVMKFIDGETLKARLARQPYTLQETLQTMTAVAQALTYAHEQGVLHRDIKPSNILLEKGTIPYIADFGLARMVSAGESTLSQDMMLGTPQYMSPEQAQGVKDLDGATDIYSLGVVLYELVVGRVPFNADTPYAIVHDQIYGALPMPSDVNPEVPLAVESVLLKALAKNRADRYTTPTQMVEAFRQAVNESNLKELSASRYRVPIAATPPYVNPLPPAMQAAMPTPSPMAGIPAPMPSFSAGSLTAAQRFMRQEKRRSLWMLLGFGMLTLSCVACMFVALSTYDTANKAGLFIPQAPPADARGFESSPPPPPGTESGTSAATELATDSATQAATASITPAVTATGATLTPTNTLNPDAVFPVLSVDDATKQVADSPNDPYPHFELAVAYGKDNQLVKMQDEFITALHLAQYDPDLLMTIARQMVANPALPAGSSAWLYAEAYANGADTKPVVRNEAGQFIYRFADGIRKRENLRGLGGYIEQTQSAGLLAFLALAYHNSGLNNLSDQALAQAVKLDPNLAEVHLIHGILYAAQNDSADAQSELSAITAASGAPGWVLSEAKRNLALLPTPTKGSS